MRFEELYVLLLTRRSTTTTGNEVRLQLRVSKTCKQYHLQFDLVAKQGSPIVNGFRNPCCDARVKPAARRLAIRYGLCRVRYRAGVWQLESATGVVLGVLVTFVTNCSCILGAAVRFRAQPCVDNDFKVGFRRMAPCVRAAAADRRMMVGRAAGDNRTSSLAPLRSGIHT